MYRCVSWTIKKAEHQRIDAFKLWHWKRLKVPFDSKEVTPVNPKGNQPWIFIGRTNAEARAPILWPPNADNWLIEKDWFWQWLGTRGEGGDRRWDDLMTSSTQWIWVWANSGRQWKTGKPGVLHFMCSQRVVHDLAMEQQSFILLRLCFFRHTCIILFVLLIACNSKTITKFIISHGKSLVSLFFSSVQFSSVAQSCSTLCDPMHCSMPGLLVHHQPPEFTQTHVYR